MTTLTADPAGLSELAPLVRRAADLDPVSLVRIRVDNGSASALIRLPFGVLVGRRITVDANSPTDGTFRTVDLIDWLDGGPAAPSDRSADWHDGRPPDDGWRRVETVPDEVIRPLVRAGALTLREAADREGVPGAQPRAEVADALLDSIVLTVADGPTQVEVSLRQISALVRMGFLARDSHLAVDIAGRWLRLAATYGSVYAERKGLGLSLQGRAQPHRGVGR
jgi:hypothetical protein